MTAAAASRSHRVRRLGARIALALLAALILGAATGVALAQPAPSAESTPRIQPNVTREQVETKLAEIKESPNLAQEAKDRLSEQYRGALTNLEAIAANNAEAARYSDALASAPAQAAALREQVASMGSLPDPPVALSEPRSIEAIEQLLVNEQAEAASIEAQISEITEALGDAAVQPAAARKRLAEATQELSDLGAELSRPQPEAQSQEARQAERWALETKRDALRAEILMLEQRILSADVRRDLANARLDQLNARLQRIRARRAYLENEADRLRQMQAEQVREETETAARELSDAHPLVLEVAQRNRELSETITEATEALDRLDERRAELDTAVTEIRNELKGARERISAAGLSQAVGQILIDERSDLPEDSLLRQQAAARAERIAELTLSQLRLRDEAETLSDIDDAVSKALADAEQTPAQPDSTASALADQVREQLTRRRDLLERALRLQDSYQRALGDLDFIADQYAEQVRRYHDFLAEHLLWVRSVAPITQQPLAPMQTALRWLVEPEHWTAVLEQLKRAARSSPLFWLGLLAVAALLASGGRFRRWIRDYAEPMRRISTDRFSFTASALGLTLLLAAPWPLLMAVLGWTLETQDSQPFVSAVGAALLAAALPFYYLRAFRLLCMAGGVADRHFRWSASTLGSLRRAVRIATLGLLPLGFVGEVLGQYDNPAFNATLTRLIVVLLCLGLGAITAAVMHPTRGVFAQALAQNPKGWLHRTRLLWYALILLVPLLLAAISLAGYLYTAGILLRSLVAELWLALVLVVLHQTIVRWLILTRRGLALEAALERRAQREAQRAVAEQGGQVLEPSDDPVDLAALDSQTRQLLNSSIAILAAVGLWMIWSDVLPALNLFEKITLWSYTATVSGVEQRVPVTLADLGLILVFATAALIAVRNLPALLEILLLKNSEVSASGRYTLVTLTRYLVTAIGVLLIVGTLGLQWSQVQWLVAALSVGIGFGLQEIVANFISGLIILFERPVRVGDTVTIGETTGTVTRIQIRATTIRNWDKQELLVPNKEFITGRLLNWTLTDQINRVVIAVGVEYGSDTAEALRLLAEVAAEHPQILDDPAPVVTFEGFGDNALNLFLRCYLETLEFRLAVITELHQAINDKFRAAGIGIAFPQRDIHLRSSEPIEVRMRRATGDGS
jgi:potassium efflux system protein